MRSWTNISTNSHNLNQGMEPCRPLSEAIIVYKEAAYTFVSGHYPSQFHGIICGTRGIINENAEVKKSLSENNRFRWKVVQTTGPHPPEERVSPTGAFFHGHYQIYSVQYFPVSGDTANYTVASDGPNTDLKDSFRYIYQIDLETKKWSRKQCEGQVYFFVSFHFFPVPEQVKFEKLHCKCVSARNGL